jgi:hypothetical protein
MKLFKKKKKKASSSGKNPPQFHCDAGRKLRWNKDATLNRMEGTSVSASILSGAVALVREYYSKNMANLLFNKKAVNPSGVLLKTLMVHASQPMNGIVLLQNTFGSSLKLPNNYPNEFNGFGIPDLSYIMPFKIEQTLENQPNFTILVENLKFFNIEDENFNYTFVISNSSLI